MILTFIFLAICVIALFIAAFSVKFGVWMGD
jgi:hypothetical protein